MDVPVPKRLPHRPRGGKAMGLLARAYRNALDAECDPWQFAISSSELKSIGLHDIDLCWLLNKGFAEHSIEITIPTDLSRTFRKLSMLVPGFVSHFVLTSSGYAALRRDRELHANAVEPQTGELRSTEEPISNAVPLPDATGKCPTWDKSQRELHYSGKLVKRYRVPARNQERILAAFQEEGWPHGIDDPLPPEGEQDPMRRLQATIKSLNRNQVAPLIRFRGNGNGDRICWDLA